MACSADRLQLHGTQTRRMKRRPILILCCIGAVANVACRGELGSSDAHPRTAPTPLIDGLMSRQRVSEVEKRLRDQGTTVTVLEDGASEGKNSKLRPPLSVRVLTAAGFTYRGMQGDLRLEFVNDELAATWFHPNDPERFAVEMKQRGSAVESTTPARVHADTELRVDVDYRGRKYWAWEDVNLRQKVERWIRKHA
jgi:hypothetical protein